MAKYRKVSVQIWNDAHFRQLSDDGKLAFLFVLTHPHMSAVGGMRATMSGLAEELGWAKERLSKAFRKPLERGMIWHDQDACLVVLPNFVKHNPPESPNVVKAWNKALDELPESHLKSELCVRISACVETLPEAFRKAFERLPKDFAYQEQEQEQEQDISLSSISEDEQPEQPEQPKQPSIVEQVIEAYHELMPMLPKCRSAKKVSKAILARIKDDPQRKDIAWWREYFAECATSDFLTGKKTDWHATLHWLTGPENMEKTLNGQYTKAKPQQQYRIPTETIPESELHKYIARDEQAGWGVPQ